MKKTQTLLGLFSVAALGLAGCSNGSTGPAESTSAAAKDEKQVSIVTSTSIWSDVADAVVDDDSVTITPIIDGDGIDPHSFEPTAADMAKVADADLIIVGGGGYDAWLYDALENDEKVIHALPLTEHHHHDHDGEEAHDHEAEDAHEHHHDGEEAHDHEAEDAHEHHHHHSHSSNAAENEHSWFSPSLVSEVAHELDHRLEDIDAGIKADAEGVDKQLADVKKTLGELGHVHFLQTHPIADQLFVGTEFHDITPKEYRKATLGHGEPSAAALAAALEAIDSGEIQLVIDTPETATEYTKRLRAAAEEKNIPVVDITETPAKGENFFDFFNAIVKELKNKSDSIES